MGSRMRKKKNILPRLERCAAFSVADAEQNKGRWREFLGMPDAPLALEIGCGKGAFVLGMSELFPDTAFVALERVKEAIIVGLEKCMAANRANLRFVLADAAALEETFAPGELSRIYINFCDPWPRNKQAKRRLTHSIYLSVYKKLLESGGSIHFKTDNLKLFEFSLNEFCAAGFLLSDITFDLHATGRPNVMTEYEMRFTSEGLPIYALTATKKDQ